MYIYKQEINDSLTSLLLNEDNCRATAYCQIVKSDENISDETRQSLSALQLTNSSINDIDLYPIRTILVTTGTNKNDDVFEKDEVWSARHTPEHKPFNIEHNPEKVIGHMIKSVGVNVDYTEISDETVVTDLPDKFHLLTDAVIYRREGTIAELISEIEDGKWFVSMECLFNNFDYLKVDKAGASAIIKRDESTAHLTKHLRIYGGTGSYNGDTYYRILRNLVFSGKGLVKNPANPDSVILNSVGVNSIQDNENLEEKQMSNELEGKIAELQAQIAEKDKSFAELQATQEVTAQTLTGLMTERDELKTSVEGLTVAKIELENQLKAKTEEYDAISAKSTELQAQLVKATRMMLAVDKGLAKDEASALIEKWASLSDEQFSDILDLAQSAKKKKDEEKKPMKEECSVNENIEEDVAGEQTASSTVIDETKVEPSVTPPAEPEANQMESVRANLREYISSLFGVKQG